MQKLNLDEFRGILVISGDGLVYEIVNGLLDRPDWENAIKIPFGQLPGGSANALACSVAYLTKEAYTGITLEQFASLTSFNMSKAIPNPIDIITFQLSNKQIVHSFLSFEWAFIADLDLETEKYRFMGHFRFVFGAVKRALSTFFALIFFSCILGLIFFLPEDLRLYRGRVSFLPADGHKNYTPKNKSIKVTRNSNASSLKNQNTKFTHLPDIDQPIPSDWLTIEENFILFLIVNLPCISPDFIGSEESTFSDGNMHLMYITEGASKIDILKILTEAENGSHFKNELVEYVKIKAFRLEPLNSNKTRSDGTMMVDGEHVSYGPIQAEIRPSLGRVLANVKN